MVHFRRINFLKKQDQTKSILDVRSTVGQVLARPWRVEFSMFDVDLVFVKDTHAFSEKFNGFF